MVLIYVKTILSLFDHCKQSCLCIYSSPSLLSLSRYRVKLCSIFMHENIIFSRGLESLPITLLFRT